MSSSTAERPGSAEEAEGCDSGRRARAVRREAARVPVDIAARVVMRGKGQDAEIVNLGIGGAFLRFAEQVPYGTSVEIVFEHSGRTLRLPAVVRWTNPEGFGAQFTELGAFETAVIAGLLARSANERVR